MQPDEELHAELMRLFRKYFEENQRLVNTGTKRACINTRNLLADIRIVARQRRAALQEWRNWKDEVWEDQKAERKAQKEAKARTSNDKQ
jgi:hypothetical protein